MPGDIAVAVLTLAILANAALMAAVLAFAGWHRGPLAFVVDRTIARSTASTADPAEPPRKPSAVPSESVRVVARETRRRVTVTRRETRSEDELDDVLKGKTAGAAYNKTIRITCWAFIIACLVIVSATDLWASTRQQIMVVLALAGIFVLVVHELMPPTGMRTARFILEGTSAIVFLSLLVHLTGDTLSPFFFAYPLLVGAAALVASPSVTLVLTVEAAAAYVVALLGQPPGDERRIFAYTGINLTALTLLAYAGMVISREQRRTRNAAIRLSTVDSLTGLFNRAYFFTTLEREISRSRRQGRDFCLLLMDVDGLKAVNDRHGHYHGDLLLRGVARGMQDSLRRFDTAARYGGDEFVVLLPETERSGAYVVAEKIRQAAAALVIDAAGQAVTTSLSIGIVSFPDDGQNADELMIAGDEAMYASKRLGKNRVVGFAPADAASGGSTPPGGSMPPGDSTPPGVPPGTTVGFGTPPGSGTPGPDRPVALRTPPATPGFRPLPTERNDEAERA